MVECILESHNIGNLKLIFFLLGFNFVLVVFVKIVLLRLTQACLSMIKFVPIEGLLVDVEDTGLDEFDEEGELLDLLFDLRAWGDLLLLLLLD